MLVSLSATGVGERDGERWGSGRGGEALANLPEIYFLNQL